MPSETFFSQDKCDRCRSALAVRTMSWFTDETICGGCSQGEAGLKRRLRQAGIDPDALEGCGCVPTAGAGGEPCSEGE